MSTRASAVRPAKDRQMFASNLWIFRTVRGSCSFAVDLRSTAKTMWSLERTPTAVVPLRTASIAYST
eukprot:scaffold23364_cov129-Isochrysis_galbana.AAC.2